MKKSFIPSLFLLSAMASSFLQGPVFAAGEKEALTDSETIDLIKNAPNQSDLPDISAVYLLMEEKDTVNEDGTALYRLRVIWKILDKQAIPSSEVNLPFNSDESTLEIDMARTITPQNNVVNVEKDAIREMTPYSGFPMYVNLKLKQFSMPAVTVGSVLEYRATLKVFKPTMPGFFYSYWSFPAGLPVSRSVFEIDTPDKMGSGFLERNMDIKPEITAKDGRKIYRWDARNVFIEGVFEPFLPPYDDACPNLIFATKTSWDAIAKWFYNMARPQLEPSDEMKEFVAGVVKRKGSDRGKIMTELYNFVSQNIRYVAMSLKSSSYLPHKAADIYRDKYGDCKDKSALLISLYALAGIDAHFALLRTRADSSAVVDFPAVDFTHCIVALPKEAGGYAFLDPTLELNRFGYMPTNLQDVNILVVKKDGYEFAKVPFEYEDISGVILNMDMKIKDDYCLEVNECDEFYGDSEIMTRMNMKYSTQEATKAYIERTLQSIFTKPKLLAFDVSNADNLDEHFWIKLRYEVRDHIKEAGKLLILDLPNPLTLEINSAVSAETRTHPLWFPTMVKETTAINILIPLGCRVNYLPPGVEKDSPFGYYKREVSSDVDKITLKYFYKSRMPQIPAARYQEFKKFVNDVVKSVKESIVLEKEEAPEEESRAGQGAVT